jgi:hypothetical protein
LPALRDDIALVVTEKGACANLAGGCALSAARVLNCVHSRVFVAQFHLDALQFWLATAESVVGLFIEVAFIATFTQRFFGK